MADDIVKNIRIRYYNDRMAETTREIENLNGKFRTLTTQIKNADGAWATTNVKVTNMATTSNKLGGALNSVMMRFIGLNAVIGYAQQGFQELQKWVGEGIENFRSFEKQMAEVNSILDSTNRESLPALEQGIVNLSVKYGQSVDDLTKGLYEIVSAAFSVTDAMYLLTTVTKASIAGLTSVTGAVKTFTGVLNAYGLSAAHAAELSDKMFMAVVRGNFTFKDLESALGYVTPIAASAGVSFDEVASAMATATRQGQHIDSVTRGLGLLIQGIIDPTKEAADAARQYGIDMSATGLRMNGLQGFFKQLSEATSKYGQQILPQLIGNMRSLRVALALTSDTGLSGFTRDMEIMETATGKTDDALAAMMNTQQQMVDILAQQMEKLERSVGEAWSGFDIWWKKTQLWWGTLFSGGDADKAVKDFDNATLEIKRAYLRNIVDPAKEGELTGFDKLMKGVSIKEAMPTETLTKYMDISDDIVNLNKEATALTNAKVALEGLQMTKKMTSTGGMGGQQTMVTFTDKEFLDAFNKQMERLGKSTIPTTMSLKDFNKVVDDINSSSSIAEANLSALTDAEAKLRPTVDQVITSFEDMASSIQESRLTIIELENEIEQLNDTLPELEDKLLIMKKEKPFEQFQHYADLAAKYGSEYINEYTDVFDEYGNNMQNIIQIIYDYNAALEDEKIATQELEKANKDLEIQMAYNNLQMLKLQLMGMIRRRGNTRAEQRQMKQLEIENTKIRIEQMKRQYEADVAMNNAENDADRAAYDEAQFILQRYIDSEANAIWELKESRDDDIADLAETIAEQKTLLAQRTVDLQTEYTNMNTMQTLYQSSLMEMAKDPTLANAYKEFFGENAITAAKTAYINYLAFLAANPVPSGVTNKVTNPTPGNATVAGVNFTTSNKNPAQLISQWNRQILGKYDNGTDFVPSTGLYMLHRGEKVTPANENYGSGGVTININNPTVSNPADISKLANTLENVVRANLVDKRTGKSKYRMS